MSSGDSFEVQGLMLNVGLRVLSVVAVNSGFWRNSNMPLAAVQASFRWVLKFLTIEIILESLEIPKYDYACKH
jgi:hypothetical protein